MEKCPFHPKGQVLYTNGEHKPEGMCDCAWDAVKVMAGPWRGESWYSPGAHGCGKTTWAWYRAWMGCAPSFSCWRRASPDIPQAWVPPGLSHPQTGEGQPQKLRWR